jgi:hypothetical protein
MSYIVDASGTLDYQLVSELVLTEIHIIVELIRKRLENGF